MKSGASKEYTKYNNQGCIAIKNHDYNLAIENLTKAIELNIDIENAYTNRGTAYFHQGKYDLALQNYVKAIELGSYNAWIGLKTLIGKISRDQLFNIIKALAPIKQIQIKSILECLDDNKTLFGSKILEGVIENYFLDLTTTLAMWTFLLGPKLVRDGTLCNDVFIRITSFFLQIDLSHVGQPLPRIENFQLGLLEERKQSEAALNNELFKLDQNETLTTILNQTCNIRRLHRMFSEESFTLKGYLANLIKSEDPAAKEKAQKIITCLQKREIHNIEQYLKSHRNSFDPTDTTGSKIWNALKTNHPDILKIINTDNTKHYNYPD